MPNFERIEKIEIVSPVPNSPDLHAVFVELYKDASADNNADAAISENNLVSLKKELNPSVFEEWNEFGIIKINLTLKSSCSLGEAAVEAILLSEKYRTPVMFKFMDVPMCVTGDREVQTVVKRYHDAVAAKYQPNNDKEDQDSAAAEVKQIGFQKGLGARGKPAIDGLIAEGPA